MSSLTLTLMIVSFIITFDHFLCNKQKFCDQTIFDLVYDKPPEKEIYFHTNKKSNNLSEVLVIAYNESTKTFEFVEHKTDNKTGIV